jgi:two-component system, chemotaxis family, CheB/CheR fusion protein
MSKSVINPLKKRSQNQFPVVGIGASAGGLDSFKKLIKTIPEDSGMAYVFLPNLLPHHEVALCDVLAKLSKIPVIELSENENLSPNHLYLIPANKTVKATEGELKLVAKNAKDKAKLPIDAFFSALAEVYQANAIGIIMSGSDIDGTLGLKDIKDNGGITFAQEPTSASHAFMPQNAINAGTVDFIIVPEKISVKLAELRKAFTITSSDDDDTAKDKIIEDCFQQIMVLLRMKVGVDFNFYKQTTVRRRIIRRMVMLQLENIVNYLDYLKKNKSELEVLFQDLLIPVTSFFRDPATYDILCETVLPEIINNKPIDSPLRIWIAGCSTGQEAYSMAMCLQAFIESNNLKTKVQIFATDLSEKAIKKARSGTYFRKELQGVSEERLSEFFTKKEGSYQINKSLRDMCIFATHNFIKDPPFAKMDFISCRNVMIYFEPFLQKKVLNIFHYALNEKGILLLGKSETIGSSYDIFTPFGKKDKFFIRKSVSGKAIRITSEKSDTIITDKNYFMRSKERKTEDFQKSAEDILLKKYSPVGVIVDEQFDIVQFRGLTGEYLEPSPGKASLNILKMAKEGLSFEIRNGLHKAKVSGEPFVKEAIPINGGKKLVTIDVIPLLNTLDLHYLILFRETQVPISGSSKGKFLNSLSIGESSEKDLRIQQLEKELAQVREDMRSITEEQESTNEELQSSNEELLSSSEELQSLNEELETSKEELQSTNEDLITVNQELYDRNEELNQSRQFAEAIIAILHEPLLILDKDFIIKSANKAFYSTFEIEQYETVSKNLFALQNNGWNIPELRNEINTVLQGKTKMAETEINFTFPKIGNRTICFNIQTINQQNGEPLILLALNDITKRKEVERMLKDHAKIVSKERKLLHGYFMDSPAIFAILKGPDHVFEFANLQHIRYTGNRDIIGKKIDEALPELVGQGFIDIIEQVYKTGEPYVGNELPASLQQEDGTIKQVFVNVNYQAIKDEKGNVEGVLTFAYDVTELIMGRKRLKQNAEMIENMSNNSSVYMSTLMGPDYTFTFINESYQNLFGKRQLMDKPLFEALPEFAGQGFEDILKNVYTVGEIFLGNETPIWLSYDEGLEPVERYFNFSYQPIMDEENQITGILVFGYEVTEQVLARKIRQDAADRFKTLAEAMPQKMNTTDAEGNVDYMNQQWFDYTNMNFEQLKDWGWDKMMHPEDLLITIEKWQHSLDTGEEFNLEQRFLRYDGTYRWHLSRGVPYRDTSGKIIAWIATHTDIEEQKVKEQQKDEFIGIASHEMKTPLTTAKAYLQLLEMSVEGDETLELYAQKANDSVERLHSLITELLDASKIQNGRLNYNISTFNFSEMVKNTIEDIRHSHPLHQIVKKGKTDKLFKGDEHRLQQVIINLLTNAIKYAPESYEVLVSVEEEENQLTVSVTDKGIGMSKKHLDKVFDRYYRVQEHAIQFQGLGIGLYISHDIVLRHGGKMWVESEIGKGSTFHFTLPFINN